MSKEQQNPFEGNRYFLELGHVPESMTLFDIWEAVTSRKWLITSIALSCTLLFGALGVILPTKYKAEVIVSEANPILKTTDPGGSSVSLDVQVEVNEALALIESRRFLTEFIVENNLMPILYSKDWDAEKQGWKSEKKEEIPTLWDAYDKFEDDVLDVETDDETGLITISMQWTEAELPTLWANEIVAKINRVLRNKAIDEADRTLQYLTSELQQTTAVEIKDSLYDLVKAQKAKIVAANVHSEYAFKIMDPAVVPQAPAIPYLTLILVSLGFVVGMFFAVTIALLLHLIKSAKDTAQ